MVENILRLGMHPRMSLVDLISTSVEFKKVILSSSHSHLPYDSLIPNIVIIHFFETWSSNRVLS